MAGSKSATTRRPRASGAQVQAAERSALSSSAADDGAWTTPTDGSGAPKPFTLYPLGTYAINAVMLRTGKVLFWSYPPRNSGGARDNYGKAGLWDPSKGYGPDAFKDVTPPDVDLYGDGNPVPAALFCSAQSMLPDGRVLVTGGNYRQGGDTGYTTNAGAKFAFIFDPQTEAWSRQPDMNQGRWYPSQVLLPDGRTVVLGGYNENTPGGLFNTDLEVFSAAQGANGSFVHASAGDRLTDLYPHLFDLPSGKVLLAGPGPSDSSLLDPTTFTWSDLPPHAERREGSTAVLRPGGPAGSSVVTQIGGMPRVPTNEIDAVGALATSETLDASSPTPSWTSDAPLAVGRSYANTVILPDASLLELGGAAGYNATYEQWRIYPDDRAHAVELLGSGAATWTTGPKQVEDRGYHSTGVLLPDGRVLSAGDDRWPDEGPPGYWSTTDTGEIYSPPYLFREPDSARPVVTSNPSAALYGDELGVGTSRDDISKVVLVAPSATTHGADMNQRYVPLSITGTVAGKGVNVRAPANANIAPPGYYMLFALDSVGAPSVARWVRLGADAPDAPVLVPDPPPTGPGPTGPTDPGPGSSVPPPPARDTTKPTLVMRLTSADLSRLRRLRRLAVELRINEAGSITLTPLARTKPRRGRAKTVTGRRLTVRMTAAGRRRITVPLTSALVRALGNGRRATIWLNASARDGAGNGIVRSAMFALRQPKRR